MKSEAQIGHNGAPKTLEEMINANEQHRVKIAPDVLKLLKPVFIPFAITSKIFSGVRVFQMNCQNTI